MLVGKIVANAAVKHVSALNVTKVSQMDGPSTRRLSNIEELNIICMYDVNAQSLCKETCQRMVPLLIGFPKLKRLFAGGIARDGFRQEFAAIGEEDNETFRVLVNHILSAYKMRLLPETIETIGSSFCYEGLAVQPRGEDVTEARSSFCRDVCNYFPLEDVFDSGFPDICGIDINDIYGIIKRRTGGKQMMQKYAGLFLIDTFLNNEIEYFELEGDDPDRADLLRRLTQAGATGGEYGWPQRRAQYLTVGTLARLDDLIGAGFDPKCISREDLYYSYNIGAARRRFDIFAKATFDALVSRGFALDENDVIVLDETKEPVLAEIPGLIRGIEE